MPRLPLTHHEIENGSGLGGFAAIPASRRNRGSYCGARIVASSVGMQCNASVAHRHFVGSGSLAALCVAI